MQAMLRAGDITQPVTAISLLMCQSRNSLSCKAVGLADILHACSLYIA